MGPFPEPGPGAADVAPPPHPPAAPSPPPAPPFLPQLPGPQALTAQTPWRAGRGQRGNSLGSGRRDGFLRSPGGLPRHPCALGPARAGRRRLLAGDPRRRAPLRDRFRSGRLLLARPQADRVRDHPRRQRTPTCLCRLGAPVVGLPSARSSSLLARIPSALRAHRTAERRPGPRVRREAEQGLRRTWHEPPPTRVSGRRRRDTARMGSTPPPRPAVVPTPRGRGPEEPPRQARVNASPPRGTCAAPHGATPATFPALRSMPWTQRVPPARGGASRIGGRMEPRWKHSGWIQSAPQRKVRARARARRTPDCLMPASASSPSRPPPARLPPAIRPGR